MNGINEKLRRVSQTRDADLRAMYKTGRVGQKTRSRITRQALASDMPTSKHLRLNTRYLVLHCQDEATVDVTMTTAKVHALTEKLHELALRAPLDSKPSGGGGGGGTRDSAHYDYRPDAFLFAYYTLLEYERRLLMARDPIRLADDNDKGGGGDDDDDDDGDSVRLNTRARHTEIRNLVFKIPRRETVYTIANTLQVKLEAYTTAAHANQGGHDSPHVRAHLVRLMNYVAYIEFAFYAAHFLSWRSLAENYVHAGTFYQTMFDLIVCVARDRQLLVELD
jgi:hypothetical protein